MLDLLVEFYEDIYEENPLEMHRQVDGQIQLTNTGDELIDKWEEQLAAGGEPDLLESFSPEGLEKLKKLHNIKNKKDYIQGRTMKEALEDVSVEARRQGLTDPGQQYSSPRSTFGIGE